MPIDVQTFAMWGVDYVKLDGCYSEPLDIEKGYIEFGYWLSRADRPMVYACSWPAYQTNIGIMVKSTNYLLNIMNKNYF